MGYFSGKKIWLVGASEGIGKCVAEQLAALGASVAISARSTEKIEQIKNSLSGNHLAVTCDVTSEASVKNAWDEVIKSWGSVDIAIYNAGVYEPINGAEINHKQAAQIFDVNYNGAMRVLEHVLPNFVAKKGGHLVLVASIAAYRGLPTAISYSSSKAALLSLAETLRCDLNKHNIKVQAVNPGFVKTRLTDKNNFKMAQIITPEKAAQHIVAGLQTKRFEITFPWALSRVFKFLRIAPYPLYFKIMSAK